jgi:hypothetical protein
VKLILSDQVDEPLHQHTKATRRTSPFVEFVSVITQPDRRIGPLDRVEHFVDMLNEKILFNVHLFLLASIHHSFGMIYLSREQPEQALGHFYYSCILSTFLTMCIMPIYLFWFLIRLLYLCRHYPNESHFPAEVGAFDEIIRRNRLMFLKRETVIVVAYLLVTLFWTWLFDIGPINSMRVTRWIIELFSTPYRLLQYIVLHYIDLMIGERTRHDLSVLAPVLLAPSVLLLKFSQLVLMRYAELFPSSRLNDLCCVCWSSNSGRPSNESLLEKSTTLYMTTFFDQQSFPIGDKSRDNSCFCVV